MSFFRNITVLLLLVCSADLSSQTAAPTPVAPLPTNHQVEWQQMETYAFIHFGTNTFLDREWGYGDAPASSFAPRRLDCEQWVRVLKAAGMKGVIFTAKHHDGFCLWPSRYTDYSVKTSPFRNGQGDVVGELAAACRKYGLRLGLYLSPWDRHQASYGTSAYVDYFHAQLEELLSSYGPIFEIWFDGANGGDGYYGGAREQRTIDRRTYYDLDRAFATVERLQPQAIIFSDGGPGCRWVGNEKGFAGETNWAFLRRGEVYPGYERFRQLTSGHPDGNMWTAAECDVSIRPGWFYHAREDSLVKSVDQLVDLYYRSVGRNATMLLNFPVDTDGLIHPQDSARAVEFHERIKAELANNLLHKARAQASTRRAKQYDSAATADDDFDTFWAARDDDAEPVLTFRFQHACDVNRLMLQEYIPLGQRVKAFAVEYLDGKTWKPIDAGEATTTIGYKRLLRFATVNTRALRIRFTDSRGPVCISTVGAYLAAEVYKDASQPVERRVQDLLSRMTLSEKIGHLRCTMAWDYYKTLAGQRDAPTIASSNERTVELTESFKHGVADEHIGMLWATFRADPWTRKTLANGLKPKLAAETANAMQRFAVEHTRLGIPLFLAEEAPHGHMAIGTTVFPTGVGMAATWQPELLKRAGEVMAKEIRLQGGHVSFGPVLDLAREPRWSRVEETFGEDPLLAARMGRAMVNGLGGSDLSSPLATLPTLKHFIAYGASDGGQNGGAATLGQRALHEDFLPPFKAAIEAGARGVMTAYNAIDGVPATSDKELLTNLLRKQWGFGGVVVSDLFSIDGLAGTHHVASSLQDAACTALDAGVDIDLGAQAYRQLADAVHRGFVAEAAVDSAVARVLRLKFEMGLFEHPYVDVEAAGSVGSAEHRQVALDMARASVTLLENRGNTLPLNHPRRVLVCGPNADNVYNMLGDYTASQPDDAVTTILEGLRAKMPEAEVQYVQGCAVRDTARAGIEQAVKAATEADVVVCCVGGSSARDFRTSYEATGAAAVNTEPVVSDMESGEGFDRATLALLGRQQELLERLRPVAKRLVVVYIEGRPLDKQWAAENADALLTAYYPGCEGGQAIADVLVGDYNPAGRLPLSVPRHVGQLPVYYNRKAPAAHDYVEMSAQPLYAFGYGKSYTTFEYTGLEVDSLAANTFRVSFNVSNTGQCDGEEVAQLYVGYAKASVVQPQRALKAFSRLAVPRGQTRRVEFTLIPDDLAIVGRKLDRAVEPTDVRLLVGASSADIRLQTTVRTTQSDVSK